MKTPFKRKNELLVLGLLSLGAASALANDFPTSERVLYVQQCMRDHPGPSFEMTHKCSCVVDALASKMKFDDYVTLSTISKAITIGGERGGVMRDSPDMESQAKRYRALQSKAEKACFISPAEK